MFEAVTLMGLTGDSPEGLAEEVGLHPSHLARLFRQQTGTTIGTLRARLQSVDAARRLREGNASLVDIAVDAGFHDQSHFTRQFRRHLGMTPGAHRTMVRGAAQAATGSASAAK